MSKKMTVLLGQLGSGKTTTFNKICNKNEKASYGAQSITKQITCSESCEGLGFKVVDTPGFGSSSDRLTHSIGILAGLTEAPVNRLLVVIKYERQGVMVDAASKILKVVRRYLHLVTIIITHWDLCENNKIVTESEAIKNEFIKVFNVNSFIFSSKSLQAKQLCENIDKVLSNTHEQLQISQTEYEVFFDNLDMKFSLDCLKDEFNEQYDIFHNTAEKFIKELQNSPELDQILHGFILFIKTNADNLLETFEKKGGETMNDIFNRTGNAIEAYFTQIELKKSIMGKIQNLIKQCQTRMIIIPDHPFNLVKKCPNCGLIWLKVDGCDGDTTCGNVPREDKMLQQKQYSRYQFTYEKQKIKYQILQKEEPKQQSIVQQKGKHLGCGQLITWSKLNCLDDAMKQQLLQDDIFDFLCNKRMEETASKKWNNYKNEMLFRAKQNLRYI